MENGEPRRENNGKLVFVTGHCTATDDSVTDWEFGVKREKILRMKRKVEMLQWKETDGNDSDSIDYVYERVWKEETINSDGFKDRSYVNSPNKFVFESKITNAYEIHLEGFTLGEEQVR